MKSKYLKSSRLKKNTSYFEPNNFGKLAEPCFPGKWYIYLWSKRKSVPFIFQCVVQMCLEYALCIYFWEYFFASGHALYQRWVCQQQMFKLYFCSVASKIIFECQNKYNSLTDISQLESNLKNFNMRQRKRTQHVL